jgi:hypothetical protein
MNLELGNAFGAIASTSTITKHLASVGQYLLIYCTCSVTIPRLGMVPYLGIGQAEPTICELEQF